MNYHEECGFAYLNGILKIGSGVDASCSSADPPCGSTPVPMETDTEEKCPVPSDDRESARMDSSEHAAEMSSDASMVNIESFLPDCVSNAARLLGFGGIICNQDLVRFHNLQPGL